MYGASPYPDLVTPVALGGVVALYTMVAWCGRTVSIVVGVLTGLSVAVVSLVPATDSDLLDVAFTTLLLAGAWVLGGTARGSGGRTRPNWRPGRSCWPANATSRPAARSPPNAPASPANCTTWSPTTSA
ncbi:hypothetical protein [Nonomuraea salmonea]|uniref:hypothetical protein n=1 Tax=Nonomuraea salmonea TaxID=46181 RepID=UPI002FEC7C0E